MHDCLGKQTESLLLSRLRLSIERDLSTSLHLRGELRLQTAQAEWCSARSVLGLLQGLAWKLMGARESSFHILLWWFGGKGGWNHVWGVPQLQAWSMAFLVA